MFRSISEQVVGPQARIVYADEKGRLEIALAFNNAIKESAIKVSGNSFHKVDILMSFFINQAITSL